MLDFDFSKFDAGVRAGMAKTLASAAKATNAFGEQLIGNAQELAPVESGALQASGNAKETAIVASGKIEKTVGFNTAYAAARHERPPEEDTGVRQNPRGQWKFLETAMREMVPKFGPFIAKQVESDLGGK
jgi:hypothetical protein